MEERRRKGADNVLVVNVADAPPKLVMTDVCKGYKKDINKATKVNDSQVRK